MASLQGYMCPQKYYSITKSQNRSFVIKNAENEAPTGGFEVDLINDNEKLLRHPSRAPTLPGA
jgi:hypothetical protein